MQSSPLDFKLRRVSTIISVAIITFTLTAAISGILVSFYYQPTAGGAYESLKTITEQVEYGWLFRKAHNVAGNGVIVCGLIQIVVMFLGRQLRKSWLTAWISGIFFTLMAIGLSWTAMVLGWTQEGFWRFSIELGTIQSIPFVGNLLREIITGGGGISTVTLEHLYTIHSYLLAVVAVVLAVVHLVGLLWQEKEMSQEMLVVSEETQTEQQVADQMAI